MKMKTVQEILETDNNFEEELNAMYELECIAEYRRKLLEEVQYEELRKTEL